MSQSTEPDIGSTDRTSDTPNSGVRAALAHRDFRRYTLGRFFATLVWQMLGVAVGWQVFSITRDPLDLGLVGLAQFLPFFALVLPAGQLADRRDRRLVIVAAYLIEILCVLTLIWFSWSGSQDVRWVFLAMALFGAGRAMWMPASQAMVVNLVPTPVFPAAVAFNSTLFEVAVIVGPAVGGILYAFGESQLHMSGALLVYCTGFVLLVIAITLIAGIRPRHVVTPTDPVSWREFTLGLRFVFQRRTVLGAISLDLFAVLFGGATALLPMFAADILRVGPARASASCVPRPGSVRRSRPFGSPVDRSTDTPAPGCSAASRYSVLPLSCSVCRPRFGCPCSHCFVSAPAIWCRYSSVTCWCSSRHRTPSAGG